jgi:protoheme IX farnesyltransferase
LLTLTRNSEARSTSARSELDSLPETPLHAGSGPGLEDVQAAPVKPSLARDLVALTKPRITVTVVATMLAGAHVAARSTGTGIGARSLVLALLGTVLVVSGANALNMYIERDSDRLMSRTRTRPLPSRRMRPALALAVGCVLGAAALPLLFLGGGLVTTALAAAAFVLYVALYTPLKAKTTLALPIGAVPGAIPPLLGWTAVRGAIEPLGLALFAVLFLWQLPHFHAIGTFRAREYERAGLKVLSGTRGPSAARAHAAVEAVVLVGASLAVALLGGAFVAVTLRADAVPARWGKRVFASSIVYLVLLLVALVVG